MRVKILLALTLLPFVKSWSQNPATVFTIPNRSVTLPCGTTCTTITAIVPNIKETNDYVLSSMPYLPFAYSTPSGIDVEALITTTVKDDRWTPKVPITFPFCYYGITYPTLLIGTNSNITFDTTLANMGSGYAIDPGGAIPLGNSNTEYSKATIFGPYHDINIDEKTPSTNSRIEYRVEGVAPNRRFITSYDNIPYFSASCSGLFATHQMVLYESTGIIEVYIQDKPYCTAWNDGLAILGIQDHTRTHAVAAPGYNATTWGSTGMDTAFRFTPSGGVTRFKSAELLVNGVVVGTGDTSSAGSAVGMMNLNFNNVCPSADSTAYVIKLTYGRCSDPSQDVSFYDTVYIKKLTPTFTLSTVDADCAGGGSITANVTGGTGVFQYSLNGGAFQAGNVFNNLKAGTYVVTTQNAVNCSFSQSIVLDLNDNLALTVLPSDTALCEGASFTPVVTSNATSYIWNGPGSFNTATSAQPVITPNGSGSIILAASQGPCVARDTINITAFAGPQADAGPDQSIVSGAQVQLQASAGAGTYLWTPPTGLSDATVLNPVASPGQTTTYTLTATTAQGCTSTDMVTVLVLDCINPMDAFTPNGDGINDLWLVNLGACYENARVEVFNRYGAKVFESRDYKNNWNGTYKGEALPDGTYYYVITLDLINGKKTYHKGNVTILR